ncbi:MAG: OmpA family protein [Steroidobacteraceae bacterium]
MRPLFVAAGVAMAFALTARGQVESPVPLVEGLAVTTAIAGKAGDYESSKRLSGREGDAWQVDYGAAVPDGNGARRVSTLRLQHEHDLRTARIYRNHFEDGTDEDYPGTTALGVSSAVLEELRAQGRARFTLVGEREWLGSALPGLGRSRNVSFSGELRKREAGSLDVIVNGKPRSLPVLLAAGRFSATDGSTIDADLALLDDPRNPLALRWRIGDAQLRVVRIDWPQPKAALAQELKTRHRVVLPGLHFDFAAATLRAESSAALPQILAALRGVDGAIQLEGHTDAIGAADRNQRLSEARAASVRAALLKLDPSLAARLRSSGFGATRPLGDNATLEGRALNRRVELVLP